jgi:lysozyme
MPHCNDAGLDIIRLSEGLELRAYPDPATGAEPWTIGYGHTCNVHPGQTCTVAQATVFLRNDILSAEAVVIRAVGVVLTPNQFSALVSFEFNTGALASSTLLRCVNQKAWAAAALQFGRWIYANGQIMPGLVLRRANEARLFAAP